MSYPFCIGTKRGVNYGLVYDHDGRVVGKVKRHARVARAALGGGTQSFWTAEAVIDGEVVGASLGTRHLTRLSAAQACIAFGREYTPDRIERVVATERNLPTWATDARTIRRIVLGRLTGTWKSANPVLCALPTR